MGDDARVDASDDDERRDEGRHGADEDRLRLSADCLGVRDGNLMYPGIVGVEQHERQAEHESGQHACGEEAADGGVRHGGIDDHEDAGRNDGADERASCSEPCGVRPGKSLLLHGRNEDGAQCGGIRGGGAVDARQNDSSHYVDVAQTSPNRSHQKAAEIDETVRQARPVHQNARKDEEGDGHEGEHVHAAEELLRNDPEEGPVSRAGDAEKTREEKGHVERNARGHLEEAQQQQQDTRHEQPSLSRRCW